MLLPSLTRVQSIACLAPEPTTKVLRKVARSERSCYNNAMTPKLSNELQSAIQQRHGQPLEVVDDLGVSYVVVPKVAYVHLSNLCVDADSATQDELRKLIQQGIESGPGIPAEKVFAELRAIATASAAREE
jgi:hypothetical protein